MLSYSLKCFDLEKIKAFTLPIMKKNYASIGCQCAYLIVSLQLRPVQFLILDILTIKAQ